MITLRIEHRISSFDGWKKAFDSDPINRKQSGVKRYRIYRPADNPELVIIELDFDNPDQAQSTEKALRRILPNIEGKLVFDVQMKFLEIFEETTL